MGENLVLNVESRGFTVSVFNRTTEKVDKFIQKPRCRKEIHWHAFNSGTGCFIETSAESDADGESRKSSG